MKLIVALGGLCLLASRSPAANPPTAARQWNEEILAAIRIDKPNPPVHARNLFHLGVAMYDCWAAYDKVAVGYLAHERAEADDVESARAEAISYAAYRILRERYALSVNAAASLKAFDARMTALGYDPAITEMTGSSPAALGNRIADAIIAWGLEDGSNERGGYDETGYFNPQPPMIVLAYGTPQGGIPSATDPNRWQPLALDATAQFQNGLAAGQIQKYLGGLWLNVIPFALYRTAPSTPWIDFGPPSRLGTFSDAEYKNGALSLLRASSRLQSDQIVDMSPGKVGNNDLGSDSGQGYPANPMTGKPYEPNLVRLGDYVRVMAEFWADGPHSETPPGHWHLLANQVADDPRTIKRIGGQGPVVSDLEWDVKTYFALGAAMHDAACAAWSMKRYYEGVRPITMIRLMASLGQSSDPSLPFYHPSGLPLEPGVCELITEQSSAPGGRHAGVGSPGQIAVFSWPGEPKNRSNEVSAVRWMLGVNWIPYQRQTFVTPAFPGYISGHSTFSRAAAGVLALITGSPFFPGGLGSFTAPANAFLQFERGPAQTTQIQWATYFDAADLAGQSRRWGGIHVPEDDYIGRQIGGEVGSRTWSLVLSYWDGSILNSQCQIWLGDTVPGDWGGRFPLAAQITPSTVITAYGATRGLFYEVQTSSDLKQWSSSGAILQATDSIVKFTLPAALREGSVFFRVVCTASAPKR